MQYAMRRFAVPVNFTILAMYTSLSLSLMIQNYNDLMEHPPQCTVTVPDPSNMTVDCELRVEGVTDCCIDQHQTSPQHSYLLVNQTAISFTVKLEGIQMFYLSKGCTLSSSAYMYCIVVIINVPMEMQIHGPEAIIEISNLPNLYKRNEEVQKLILQKTNVLVAHDAEYLPLVAVACSALHNTSLHQHVRSNSLVLVARPSPRLTDQLTAELIKRPCNASCVSDEPQNCEARTVQIKNWSNINEPLLFNKLDPGSFYCVLVRYWTHLNCAITLSTFKYRGPKELALSEKGLTKQNVHLFLFGVSSVFVSLCMILGAILFIVSFVRGQGPGFTHRPIIHTMNPIPSTGSQAEGSSSHRHSSTAESSPPPILLLYSRDSLELCNCMKALANVLAMSTGAEVLDPLNDSWGVETEKYRDAGLSHWLFAVLRNNCSVLLLMSPGGKMRENAIVELETVMFDPPNMLDDIFLLGFDYIKTQKASDYASVFQISFEDIGNTGETYSVGVPLAKYILPQRLRQLISTLRRDNPRVVQQEFTDETHHFHDYDKYSEAIMKFEKSLEDLKVHYAENPQYMDRTLCTVNKCSETG